MKSIKGLLPLVLLFTGACKDVEDHDHDHHHHEHETITTIELTFSPADGSGGFVFVWTDPEDDGSPVIDDIVLSGAVADYQLSVSFWNELESPRENITPEIEGEGDEHQIFFTGSGVEGPATGDNVDAIITHAYADADADGNPIGLVNEVSTVASGTGELELTMRHLAYENNEPVKTDSLADDVASSGFDSIPGDNDVQITFNIEVE